MYNGRHDETFYSLVAVKLFVLLLTIVCIFIFYYTVTAFIQRRTYRIIVIFGILMAFNWLLITTESEEYKQSKEIFFHPAPGKYGNIDLTEEEMLLEIESLKLSKKKSQKAFLICLKANEDRLAELKEISKVRNLTEKEERNMIYNQQLIPYCQRGLRAVERMED